MRQVGTGVRRRPTWPMRKQNSRRPVRKRREFAGKMVRGRRSPGVAPRTHAEFKLPQPGFSKTIFWATLCGLHTASFLLRQLALRPGRRLARGERPIKHWEISSVHNAAGEGLCPLFGVGEPAGGRYRPGTLHEVQGQLPRPGPPNSKRLFAAMSKLRSHHLFRRRGDRSQRPARDSRCQTIAPGASRGG